MPEFDEFIKFQESRIRSSVEKRDFAKIKQRRSPSTRRKLHIEQIQFTNSPGKKRVRAQDMSRNNMIVKKVDNLSLISDGYKPKNILEKGKPVVTCTTGRDEIQEPAPDPSSTPIDDGSFTFLPGTPPPEELLPNFSDSPENSRMSSFTVSDLSVSLSQHSDEIPSTQAQLLSSQMTVCQSKLDELDRVQLNVEDIGRVSADSGLKEANELFMTKSPKCDGVEKNQKKCPEIVLNKVQFELNVVENVDKADDSGSRDDTVDDKNEVILSAELLNQIYTYFAVKFGSYQRILPPSHFGPIVQQIVQDMHNCFASESSRSAVIELHTVFDCLHEDLMDNAVCSFKKEYNVNVRYICIDPMLQTNDLMGAKHIVEHLLDEDGLYDDESDISANITKALEKYAENNTLLVIGIKALNHLMEAQGHGGMKILYALMDACASNSIGSGRVYIVASCREGIHLEKRVLSRFDKHFYKVYDPKGGAGIGIVYDWLCIESLNIFSQYNSEIRAWNKSLTEYLRANIQIRCFLAHNPSTATILSFCRHFIHVFKQRQGRAPNVSAPYFLASDAVFSIQSVQIPGSFIASIEVTDLQMNMVLAAFYAIRVLRLGSFCFELLFEIYKNQVHEKDSKEIFRSEDLCFFAFSELCDKGIVAAVEENVNKYKLGYRFTLEMFDLTPWLQKKFTGRSKDFQTIWFKDIMSKIIEE